MGRWSLRLLLDTHALIWWLQDGANLPQQVRRAIEDSNNDIFVSAVSAIEVTTKFRLGKLPSMAVLAEGFEREIAAEGFQTLSVTVGHAALAGMLPSVHRDPFDRTLIAQALIEGMVLASNEVLFDSFGVRRLW